MPTRYNVKSVTISYDGGISSTARLQKSKDQPEPSEPLPAGLITQDGWFGEPWYKLEVPTDPSATLDATVLDSYDNVTPESSVEGLVYDGTNLWASDNNGVYNGNRSLLRVTPSTLAVTRATEPPLGLSLRDLAVDGDYLRVINGSRIYRYDIDADSFVDYVSDPTGASTTMSCLEFRDGMIWLVQRESGGFSAPWRMWQLNATTGAIITSKTITDIPTGDIVWGLQYLDGYWWIGSAANPFLYKYDWDSNTVVQRLYLDTIHEDIVPFPVAYVPEDVM
ncbi:MAG: hypothetical protein ACQ5SW_03365 [Sphaerochaetaceae bacterium]